MPGTLTIGDFSRITHLTVKTLRRYHEVGLLEPAEVDPQTGYRYYAAVQVPKAPGDPPVSRAGDAGA
jgi:DNA-binding transcriptional MerR regulator